MATNPKFNHDDRPQFCIIAPTAYLDTFARASTTHLVLAHLVDTDEKYTQFYADASIDGHKIILDNGAFELGQSYDPDKLVKLGKRCGAHMIVLPDYPNADYQKTINAAVDYAPLFHNAGFQTMFVPQAEVGNYDDWLTSYIWGKYSEHVDAIGMSILNVPNALPNIDRSYVRVVATQMLLNTGRFAGNKYHHYLGLNAGPALEIPSLIKLGALNSCDSSGPVWAGICGHEYTRSADSFQTVKKITKHVDFEYPFVKDKETLRRIHNNINLTLSLFHTGTAQGN